MEWMKEHVEKGDRIEPSSFFDAFPRSYSQMPNATPTLEYTIGLVVSLPIDELNRDKP